LLDEACGRENESNGQELILAVSSSEEREGMRSRT
jgi:hypothetical protein